MHLFPVASTVASHSSTFSQLLSKEKNAQVSDTTKLNSSAAVKFKKLLQENMTINETQDELIEEFELFSDWMEKYENIIQMGKELPLIDDQYKTDDNLIKGCQSKVWLHADYKEGNVLFTADSDAVITKGLVAMVVRVLSGHTPQEIANAELYFVDRVGLKEHLSMTRSNGLVSMIKQMKIYAIALQASDKA